MKADLLIADPKEADWDTVSEILAGEGSSVYFEGSAGQSGQKMIVRIIDVPQLYHNV